MEVGYSTCASVFKNPQSVLFITSQLRPREIKMAHALRSIGWVTGLIYQNITPFDSQGHFDYIWEVKSAAEAYSCAKKLSPRIIHVFSGAIDDFVLSFCRKKLAPVVIDLNDIFAPSLFDYCHERFDLTKEALRLADGFCARDLQAKFANRIDGFQLPSQTLLFPEYCWSNLQPQVKPNVNHNEIHVVSIGTISLETQGTFDSCYLELIQHFIAHEIHFHVYPHWAYRKDNTKNSHANFQKDFAQFLELERKSFYLHIHNSLSTEDLAKELPQYDFGIIAGGCPAFGQKLKHYKPSYLASCYSGRISDYLDARLPVLINDEVAYNYWLLKRYGVYVDLKKVTQPGFKTMLQDYKKNKISSSNMDNAIRKLSIEANAKRLAAFYNKTIKSSPVPCKNFFKNVYQCIEKMRKMFVVT